MARLATETAFIGVTDVDHSRGLSADPPPLSAVEDRERPLLLTLSSGYAGTTGSFTRTPTGWQGVFRTFSDARGELLWERDFTLTEVSCDAPSPNLPACFLVPTPYSSSPIRRLRS
jgi:hypothetical protein